MNIFPDSPPFWTIVDISVLSNAGESTYHSNPTALLREAILVEQQKIIMNNNEYMDSVLITHTHTVNVGSMFNSLLSRNIPYNRQSFGIRLFKSLTL